MVNIACDSRLSLHCWFNYEQIAIYICYSKRDFKNEETNALISTSKEHVCLIKTGS